MRATLQFDGFNPVKGRVWTMANPEFTASQNRDALRDGTRINGLQIDVTSAQTITNSAQAILNSGEVLANPKSPITRLLQPFSATVFLLENPKRNILSIAAETNSSVRLEFEGISRNYSILVTDSMKEPIIWTPVTNLTSGSKRHVPIRGSGDVEPFLPVLSRSRDQPIHFPTRNAAHADAYLFS